MEDSFGCRRRFAGQTYDCESSAIDDAGVFPYRPGDPTIYEDGRDEPQRTVSSLDDVGVFPNRVDTSRANLSSSNVGGVNSSLITSCGEPMTDTETTSDRNLFDAMPPADRFKMRDAFARHMSHCIGDYSPEMSRKEEMAMKASKEITNFVNRLSQLEHWVDVAFHRISCGISHLVFLEQRIVTIGSQQTSTATSPPMFLTTLPEEIQPMVPLLLAKSYADLAHSLEEPENSDGAEYASNDCYHRLTSLIHNVLVESALVVLRLLDSEFPAQEELEPEYIAQVHQEYMSILSLFTSFEPGPVLTETSPPIPSPEEKNGVGGVLSYITDSLAAFSLFSNSGADDSIAGASGENDHQTKMEDSPFFKYLAENSSFFQRFAITEQSELYPELAAHHPSTAVTELSKLTMNYILEKIGFHSHVAREHMTIVSHLRHKINDPLENVREPLESIYDRYRECTIHNMIDMWVTELRQANLKTKSAKQTSNSNNNNNNNNNNKRKSNMIEYPRTFFRYDV